MYIGFKSGFLCFGETGFVGSDCYSHKRLVCDLLHHNQSGSNLIFKVV